MSSLLNSLRHDTSVAMVSSRKKFGVQAATCSVARLVIGPAGLCGQKPTPAASAMPPINRISLIPTWLMSGWMKSPQRLSRNSCAWYRV